MQSSLSAEAIYARLLDKAQDLPPPPWAPLAETPASLLFDLHDGGLLKVFRKRGALSSGEARWRRETSVLKAFGSLSFASLHIPRFIADGECEASGLLDMPLAGWIRREKLDGRTYNFDMFSILPSERRERMGEKLGVAIASLHQSEDLPEIFGKLGDPISRQLALSVQSLAFPQDLPKLRELETRWSVGAQEKVLLHGNLTLENVLWKENDVVGFTGWSEAGAGDPVSDLAGFEPLGALRDAVLRGYGARMGKRVDMARYRLAAAAHAFVTLALEGDQGHPREGMRRRRMLEEYLYQAGIE